MTDSIIKPIATDLHTSTLAGELFSLHENSLQSDLTAYDEILNRILHHARSQLGMEVAYISDITDATQCTFRYVNSTCDFTPPIHVNDYEPLEDSLCLRIIDGRLPELISDCQENKEAVGLAVTSAFNIGAYMSVPLELSDQTIYGTFSCFSRQANYRLNQDDLESMRFLARCAMLVIEQHVIKHNKFDQLQRSIINTIESQTFFPVYQPLINLQNLDIAGFEALTRFTASPRKTPDMWFNLARDVCLQSELEIATLSAATAACSNLRENQFISFNLSANSIVEKQPEIVKALKNCQSSAVIEVTEHEIIEDYKIVNDALKPLRAMGIKLAVDDVGAGFASLKHILSLKPDIIKIDQSIVKNIDLNSDAQAITRAIVSFSQEIKYDVVAEGIETSAELETLKQAKVYLGQGFLLGVPNRSAINRWR